MKSHLSFLYWFLFLITSVQAVKGPRAAGTQPDPGKQFYTVFPKAGVDTSKTVDFIKATVGADDLLPWTDVQDKLLHWTVEASDEEFTRLQQYADIDRVTKFDPPPQPSKIARRDPRDSEGNDSHLVFPKDGKNYQQTDTSLKNLVGDKVQKPHIYQGVAEYWVAALDDAQVKQVQGFPGVLAVEPNSQLDDAFVIPEAPEPSPAAKLSDAFLDKRDLTYSTQEFAHVAQDHLVTTFADAYDLDPSDDDSDDSHGTCTADKAVGKEYGVSKGATLVVVKSYGDKVDELIESLELIADDIKKRPERRKKSVVTLSRSVDALYPNSAAKLKTAMQALFAIDVPLVVVAGNHAKSPGRENVDTYPATLSAPDVPVIVVGNADSKGQKADDSQGGDKVTVYAVGEWVACITKSGSKPGFARGTSVSTPMVAGEIANLLSYDTVPFDTSDGNLVKNLKAYLQSDKASWARQPNIRLLWNGVTEAHNPKAAGQSKPPPPPPSNQPKVTCNGLAAKKYAERDVLKNLIETKFCPDAAKQGHLDKNSGSIARNYNPGNPDQTAISMDYKPGLNFKPNEGDCAKYLMLAVDGCDGNNPKNPENYKGGGSVAVGPVTYRVTPQALRQPSENGEQAGCDSSYKALFNEYTVWGHGFDSDDNGNGLQNQLKGCALLPDTFSFSYGLGSDGREWTAKFRTGVFQKSCVGNAVKSASGLKNFSCSGSG
ncbi:subtilisin-like protein [Hypoxylon sp. FL0543]|nr:subtilisin-like protein [Hypoxylon sp. FL0543]